MQCIRRCFLLILPLGFLFLSGCGIYYYPGQPGMVSDGYVKIDLEELDAWDGLYVYEASYDNREGGTGVGAIVTKLYPNAQTFTSNVRMNADGTVLKHKSELEGAVTQMISIPSIHQLMLPANSKVGLLLYYYLSLDEVDNRNIAEQEIFTNSPAQMLSRRGMEAMKTRLALVRAGNLQPSGNLAYTVNAATMEGKTFTPSASVTLEMNLGMNGVHLKNGSQFKGELQKFLEANFPKGYQGPVEFNIEGMKDPMVVSLGLMTPVTAKMAGYTVIHNATAAMLEQAENRFARRR